MALPKQVPIHGLRDARLNHRALRNIGASGGWVSGQGVHKGKNPPPGTTAVEVDEAAAEVQQWATGFRTLVRFTVGIRFDVVTPDARHGWHGRGFDPRWIARVPWYEYLAAWGPWASAGWDDPVVHSHVVPGFAEGLRDLDRLTVPVAYPFLWDGHRVVARSWVIDQRIPAAREWLVEEAVRGMQRTRASALQVELKMHYWRHHPGIGTSTGHHVPAEHPGGPGPITPTFYGPGEWELAQNATLRELLRHLPCGVVTSVRGRGWEQHERWDWMDQDVRDRWIGETVTPELAL